MDKKFAIIDIETTGGSAKRDKITEIAIVLHDGSQILDTWQTLINPERSIPYFITKITGINDEMVHNAPKFYEIAKEIVERTEDALFVAHNVRFDYGFIAEEFSQLGYTYSKPQLCTVQMSRRAFPGLKSYSLGNLVQHFSIPLPNHHRAMDDALATSELFSKIVQSTYYQKMYPILGRQNLTEQKLPAHIDRKYLDCIPNAPGVYYFLNEKGQIIYVGKSIHLRKRIYDHFADKSERAARLQAAVSSIDYQYTGNELAALLLESFEIKALSPLFNKAQRRRYFKYGIGLNTTKMGIDRFEIVNLHKNGQSEILKMYTTKEAANSSLSYYLSESGICNCIRKQVDQAHCIEAKLEICAAIGKEGNLEEKLLETENRMKSGFQQDGILSGPGRNNEEVFVILIHNYQFAGMGYVSKDTTYEQPEELLADIQTYPANPEVVGIINGYLKDHTDIKFIPTIRRLV